MSSIYILDENLDLLISREYKYDIDSSFIAHTFKKLVTSSKQSERVPILFYKGINFIYLHYDKIILLTISINDVNCNAMLLMTFLMKFSKLLKEYFITFGVFESHEKLMNIQKINHQHSKSNGTGNNHNRVTDGDHSDGRTSRIDENQYVINSDLIRDNYILIYELFDETMDFGVPQITEFNILKEYIKSVNKSIEVNENDLDEFSKAKNEDYSLINSSVSRASTNNISWRIKGIFYNKNEFFINFTENIKFHYNLHDDTVMSNSIVGIVDCLSYISGMPTLKLGLNESLKASTDKNTRCIFDNINFHQCVELDKLNSNTSILFIPPDGNFQLMNYQIFRLSAISLKPLLLIDPMYKVYQKKKKKKVIKNDQETIEKSKEENKEVEDKEENFKLKISIDLITYFKRKYSMKNIKIVIPLIIKQITENLQELNDYNTLVIDYNKTPRYKTKLGSVVLNIEKQSVDWYIPQLDSNLSQNDLKMVCELDLITKAQLYKNHSYNAYHGKQDKNDLIHLELKEEFEKIDYSTHRSNPLLENDIKANTTKNNYQSTFNHEISVRFELNEITYSGIQVEFLSIKDPILKYQSFPWVRYITKCENDKDYTFKLSKTKNFANKLAQDMFKSVDDEIKPAQLIKSEISLASSIGSNNDGPQVPTTLEDTTFTETQVDHATPVISRDFEEYMVEGEGDVTEEEQEEAKAAGKVVEEEEEEEEGETH